MQYQLYPHIISDPDILAGTPVVEGTHVPASTLIGQVAAGTPLDVVAQEHGVSVEDVRAALEFGAQRANEPGGARAVPATSAEAGEADLVAAREPVSDLGKRLAAIRQRIVASGTPLLTWDDLDAEMDTMRR